MMLKKILALVLALMLMLAMAVSCSDEQPGENPDGSQGDSGTEDQTPDNDETEKPDQPQDPNAGEDEPKPVDPEAGMIEVNEEVYALVTVDLRSAPEVGDNVVKVLRYKERAIRVKVSEEWSKVKIGEETYYVATNCLDIYVPLPTSQEMLCVMTPKLNLRAEPDAASEKLGEVVAGDTLIYLGANDDGSWYQVEKDGEKYYVNAAYLLPIGVYTMLPKAETKYVLQDNFWLRSYPDDDFSEASRAATVVKGDALQCIGYSENGNWAMLSYNGKTLYAKNTEQYLSYTDPLAPSVPETPSVEK